MTDQQVGGGDPKDVSTFFDGTRLTLARHLAGLRKNALAELVDKTPTAIASFHSRMKR